MKAPLLAVLANFITPSHHAGSFIERVENTRTRSNKDGIQEIVFRRVAVLEIKAALK